MSSFIRWISQRLGISIGATVVLAIIGFIGLMNLPVDAVPDVTNNQVQVVTAAPALAGDDDRPSARARPTSS